MRTVYCNIRLFSLAGYYFELRSLARAFRGLCVACDFLATLNIDNNDDDDDDDAEHEYFYFTYISRRLSSLDCVRARFFQVAHHLQEFVSRPR